MHKFHTRLRVIKIMSTSVNFIYTYYGFSRNKLVSLYLGTYDIQPLFAGDLNIRLSHILNHISRMELVVELLKVIAFLEEQ